MSNLIPMEKIENKIYLIRGQKVMFDFDLARLYGVETKQLKRAVKRNKKRFPADFLFKLNKKEQKILRCQFGTLRWGAHSKYHSYVFTELGVAMLSSVLNSEKAIFANLQIMRAFAKLRKILSSNKEILRKIEEMEGKYDAQFKVVFDAIKKMMTPPSISGRKIGFLRGGEGWE